MTSGLDTNKPAVMCFSGLDPTGGAGIQADIETLFSIGCHCCPIATVLTAQTTQNALSATPTEPALLIEQARAVLEDMQIQAIKIGLLGSVASVEVIHTLLKDYADIPVVLDPVLVDGGGFEFSNQDIQDAIRELLIPLCTVLTPNTIEAKALAPSADNLDACANELIDMGCEHILITGTHAQTDQVHNRLYSLHHEASDYQWPRLQFDYHGSGCTLAAAIAGYLAHHLTVPDAVQQAQRFTWESLNSAERQGFGQHIPDRSYWKKR